MQLDQENKHSKMKKNNSSNYQILIKIMREEQKI